MSVLTTTVWLSAPTTLRWTGGHWVSSSMIWQRLINRVSTVTLPRGHRSRSTSMPLPLPTVTKPGVLQSNWNGGNAGWQTYRLVLNCRSTDRPWGVGMFQRLPRWRDERSARKSPQRCAMLRPSAGSARSPGSTPHLL